MKEPDWRRAHHALGRRVVIRRPAAGQAGVAAALLVLVATLFRRAVFGGEAFYERDIQFDWYPQIEVFVRAVAAGSFPLWDDTIAFGQPLLADPSAQVLYPFTWLNLVVRPWTYYTLFVVAHVWFSSVGLYLAARRMGVSPAAGLTAATLWATSGPLLSMVNLWHHFASACWIPWVFLAADRLLERRQAADVLPLSAALAGQLLGGSGDVAALTQLLVAAVAFTRAAKIRPFRARARPLALTGVAWAGALAVTAIQWLPAVEVARRSGRWALPDEARTTWSLTPAALLQTVFPAFLQDAPLRPELRRLLFDSSEPFLPSVYLGLPALVLVAAAFSFPRRKALVFLGIAALAGTFFALGRYTPFYGLTTRALPVLTVFRYPVKAVILPAFCWALLAGMGTEALLGQTGRSGRSWRFLVAGALLMIGAAAVLAHGSAIVAHVSGRVLFPSALSGRADLLAPVARQLAVSATFGALTLLAIALASSAGGAGGRLAILAASGISVVDLFLVHQSLNRTAPRELLAFTPPVLETVLREDHSRLYVYEYFQAPEKSERYLGRRDPYVLGGSNRLPLALAQVLSQRLYPAPPSAGRWGLEGSYDVDFRRLYPSYLAQMSALLRDVEGTPAHLRLLRLGAVSHVIALHTAGFEDLVPAGSFPSLFPEPIRLFRVPAPLPRSYVVSGSRLASEPAALRVLIDPSFDPSREVLLAEGSAVSIDADFIGTARVVDRKPDRVRAEAKLSSSGFLVCVDAFDPGWKVPVDGMDARMLRANVAFRAVHLTAGEHVVEWAYRPAGVSAGLAISAASALAAATLVSIARSRRGQASQGR
jgi:hypothetical protein